MNESWKDTLVHASRPVRFAATAALSMLALFLLVATIDGLHNWGHEDTPATQTITVTGEGSATAKPDTAAVTFSVIEQATDAASAQQAAAKKENDALAALKKEGLADEDVRTTSYSISPQYKQNAPCYNGFCPTQGGTEIIGYQVTETIEAKVHDLTKVSAVLSDLGTLGVQEVTGPNLTVADEDSVKAQARGEAIMKARANAQTLAKQLGVSLGDVVGYSDDNGGMPQPFYAKATATDSMAMGAVTPSIPSGQNEYTSTVTVTYEIH